MNDKKKCMVSELLEEKKREADASIIFGKSFQVVPVLIMLKSFSNLCLLEEKCWFFHNL